MGMREGTCLHCGARFEQSGTGRNRSWCYDCLPHAAAIPPKDYQARLASLASFKSSGVHASCCGRKRCRVCDVIYEPWCTWEKPGPAGSRCQPCYLAYTREKRTPKPRRTLAPGKLPAGVHWQAFTHSVYASETHCGFCGEYVDQTLPHNDRMARTVDHIVPVSQGGAVWDRSNVRLAHRSCNSAAGNRLAREATEQRLTYARAALWISGRLTA